jgi:xanthine dehydrogenase accessory factor
MAEVKTLIETAQRWRGARRALATVIATWGSAPRPTGSHMLVHEDGRFEGSVSGGCVEGDVLALAADVIAGAPAILRDYGVADPAAWEVGLPCGGSISVLVQRIDDDGFPDAVLDVLADNLATGEGLAVSTDLTTGRSRIGEDAGAFVNRYRPPRSLIIVGAVQIAQSLAMLARALELRTVVVDPRGRFLTAERFPGVELDDRWPDEAIAARNPGPSTAVVTLSHDPKIDDPALLAALAAPTGYVAALGSRRSHAARLERLAAAGADPAALSRIDGPAGIDIGAIGPAEIALSIAAGMTRALHEPKS